VNKVEVMLVFMALPKQGSFGGRLAVNLPDTNTSLVHFHMASTAQSRRSNPTDIELQTFASEIRVRYHPKVALSVYSVA
jgi:hypothetical protein